MWTSQTSGVVFFIYLSKNRMIISVLVRLLTVDAGRLQSVAGTWCNGSSGRQRAARVLATVVGACWTDTGTAGAWSAIAVGRPPHDGRHAVRVAMRQKAITESNRNAPRMHSIGDGHPGGTGDDGGHALFAALDNASTRHHR